MKNIPWNENLRLCREQHGDLQKELSAKLNISKKTLQRYENGLSEPTISTLLKLSEIYDLSIDEIIGNKNNKTFNYTSIDTSLKQIENICNNIRDNMYEKELYK